MDRDKITQLTNSLNAAAEMTTNNGDVEYWYARDIMAVLDYDRWENFYNVIQRAMTACETSGASVENHFREVTKMVTLGFGAEREIDDIMLTRYACYLIAQNGDPRKEPIAFAQTYFAMQTRKQELIEERLLLHDRLAARAKLTQSESELSKNIYERGVDGKGISRIRFEGDAALFGGVGTGEMKDRMKVPAKRPLADFLPTVTIAAKNLATEMTNHNVTQRDLTGEESITKEHVENNRSVRGMLGKRGIKPEDLPPEEDIKKLERQVKSSEKKLKSDKGLGKK